MVIFPNLFVGQKNYEHFFTFGKKLPHFWTDTSYYGNQPEVYLYSR